MVYLGFLAQLNYPSLKARAYLHKAGISAWGENALNRAGGCFIHTLEKHNFKEFDFFLATLWANEEEDFIVDLFGFRDIYPWPGNPEVTNWVIKEGVIVPDNKSTCGDTLIVLGEEEKFRRTRRDLTDYLENPPGGELETYDERKA